MKMSDNFPAEKNNLEAEELKFPQEQTNSEVSANLNFELLASSGSSPNNNTDLLLSPNLHKHHHDLVMNSVISNPPTQNDDEVNNDSNCVKIDSSSSKSTKKNYKKGRRLTDQNRLEVIELVESASAANAAAIASGGKHGSHSKMKTPKRLSNRKIAERYDVTEASIRAVLRNKDRIRQRVYERGGDLSAKRECVSLYPEVERRVLMWVQSMMEDNQIVTGARIQKEALRVAQELNITKFSASSGWLSRFKSRNKNKYQNFCSLKPHVLVATRIHNVKICCDENGICLPGGFDFNLVDAFCKNASLYGDEIVIALETEGVYGPYLHKILTERISQYKNVVNIVILPISYWGNFVPALNALVSYAARKNMSKVLFQSLEVKCTREIFDCLVMNMKETDLVVGAALCGHDFMVGDNDLNGRTTPWNTLALWDVKKLARTGFLLVAEGLEKSNEAGVEEVTVISLLQILYPFAAHAKLLQVPGIAWETTWSDSKRIEIHENKMASKISRPKHQMNLLGISPGKVTHIKC